MVLVSTADKRKIYDYLLSEGVFCSKKVKIILKKILKTKLIKYIKNVKRKTKTKTKTKKKKRKKTIKEKKLY
jgi:hypothetical protein